jgi:hypothetical protein
MKRGVTPVVQAAIVSAVVLILVGLLFGLKPVTRDGGVYARGEYACGSAWNPLYSDLATSFDESCWDSGIRSNLTASLVLVGLGVAIGLGGFKAASSNVAPTGGVIASRERRPCRHCAEDIRPGAKVCPYCWRDARPVGAGRPSAAPIRPLVPAHEPDYVVHLQ